MQQKIRRTNTLDYKVYVKLGNKPKIIKLIEDSRKLAEKHNKMQKEFMRLTSDDLEDYFWDLTYSIFPVEKDLRDLLTSKRIDWSK